MPNSKRGWFDGIFWFQWIVATTLGWLLGSFFLPSVIPVVVGLGIGALQWPALSRRMPKSWRWIVASAIGGAGWAIAFALLPPELDFYSGLLLGTAMGIPQWLILRREVHWAGWWIPVSGLAWSAGLAVFPGLFSSGAVAGAITGLALELLLRTPLPRKMSSSEPRSQGTDG